MTIMGIDPGLTRCGVGVIEVPEDRRLRFVHVDVLRSSPEDSQDIRLLQIWRGLNGKMDRFAPDVVSIEQVFAQHNVNTVLGTAMVAGLAMVAAADRNIPVAVHTPSQVKLAVTGNGTARKPQVEMMVARILGLNKPPTPPDAADALAQAITHALHPNGELLGGEREQHLTAAQRQWTVQLQRARNRASSMHGRGM